MILTCSCLWLLALVGFVEPYPFAGGPQASGPTFNTAQHFQQPLYSASNQQHLINNNAQRYFQPQQQQPRFNPNVFRPQQLLVQPQQVALPAKTRHQPPSYGQLPIEAQLPQHARLAQQAQPTRGQNSYQQPAPIALADKDFLSELQVIDPNGNLREFKDFGIGGDGNQPHDPELERQLRSIFEMILNKDLAHAEFLPLNVNSNNHQQPRETFQESALDQQQRYPSVIQNAHRSSPQHPPQPLPQHHQQQQNLHQQQHAPTQQQQQQQRQYQYLTPRRTATKVKSQEPIIKSPAQTLREAQKTEKVQQQRQEEEVPQRPIEQQKVEQVQEQEILNQPAPAPAPVKGGPAVEQVRVEQQQEIVAAPVKSVAPVSAPKVVKTQQPAEQQRQEPFVQQQLKQVYQSKSPAPIEQKQTQQQVVEQQQQQLQGFYEEFPAANQKTVERDLGQVKQQPARPIDEQLPPVRQEPIFEPLPPARVPVIEQQRIEPQQEVRQQQIEEPAIKPVQSISKSKKFDGWVPITHQQQNIFGSQQKIENFEQVKEDQGFDERKNNFAGFEQQKEAFQTPIEQQKQEVAEPAVKSDGDDRANQEQITDIQQQQFQQQLQIPQQPRESLTDGGKKRFVKLRKSVNKLAASAKSRLHSNQGGNSHKQQVQSNVQQEERISQQKDIVQAPEQFQLQREEVQQQHQQQEELLSQVLEQQREGMFQTLRDSNGDIASQQPKQQFLQATKFTEQVTDEPVSLVSSTVASTSTQAPTTAAPTPAQVVKGRKVRVLSADKIRSPVQQKALEQQATVVKQQRPQTKLSASRDETFKQPVQKLQQQEQKSLVSVPQLKKEVRIQQQQQQQQEETPTLVQQKEESLSRGQQEADIVPEFQQQRVELPPPQQPQELREQLVVQKEVNVQQQQERVGVPEQQTVLPDQQQREQVLQQRENSAGQQVDDLRQQQQVEDVQVKQPVQPQEEIQSQQREEIPTLPNQQTQVQVTEEQQQQQREESPALQVREEGQAQTAQQEEVSEQQRPENQLNNAQQQRVEATQQQQEEPVQQKQPQQQVQSQEDNLSQPQQLSQGDILVQQQQQNEEISGQRAQSGQDEGSVQQQDLVPSQQVEETPAQQQRQEQLDNDNAQQPLQPQQQQREDELPQQAQQQEEPQQREAELPITSATTTTTSTTTVKPEIPRTKGLRAQQRARTQSSKSTNQIREDQATELRQEENPVQINDTKQQDNVSLSTDQEESTSSATESPEAPSTSTQGRFVVNQRVRGESLGGKSDSSNTQQRQKNGNLRVAPRRFLGRQRNQQVTNEGEAQTNNFNKQQQQEGPLSAHQLLNTYNPLQFEPERISSLNKAATESSSQNTNVNPTSGESY